MSDTPEQIAARLSAAQKHVLCDLGRLPDGHWQNGAYAVGERKVLRRLKIRNLIDWSDFLALRMCAGRQLTPLGQAVRAVLEAQKP